jgi:outer membrane lipoprotein LolB
MQVYLLLFNTRFVAAKHVFKLLFCAILCAALSSCATEPTSQQPISAMQPSTIQPQKINQWQIRGSIAVKAKPPLQSFSASLNWRQKYSHYFIYLFGPLGIGSVKIYGQPGKFILQTAANEKFTASSPTQLIKQQLNIILPVTSLFYWIRGLPLPTAAASKKFDNFGHLIAIKQQNWQITYLSYVNVAGTNLPHAMLLKHRDFYIKIIINHWKLQ